MAEALFSPLGMRSAVAEFDATGHFVGGAYVHATARDWARSERPAATSPEILLPETAHASFQKAAHYLGLTPVVVPVDPETFLADPETLRQAITPQTIMMVGSAISYAHGVVDPIE